jgi:hypothetical protein
MDLVQPVGAKHEERKTLEDLGRKFLARAVGGDNISLNTADRIIQEKMALLDNPDVKISRAQERTAR